MDNLGKTQNKILDFLLDHPSGVQIQKIVEFLGVTKTAAREHIVKLESLGHVAFKDVSGKVGRPKRHYFLTENGKEALPKQYSWLSLILLKQLAKDMDRKFVLKFLDNLADNVSASMEKELEGIEDPKKLLQKISEILTRLGYRSFLRQSDLRKGAVLEATNCVYHSVAQEHPQLCHFDVKLIENLSGLDVQLQKCIAKGDSVCKFCLKKK